MVVRTGRLAGMRVLVAEDDYFFAHKVCVWLEEEGVEVVGPFASAGLAIEALGREKVDFALIDMVLNDSGADRLLERAYCDAVPHAILTGYERLPTNAYDTAISVLRKDVEWDDLFAVLTPYAPSI